MVVLDSFVRYLECLEGEGLLDVVLELGRRGARGVAAALAELCVASRELGVPLGVLATLSVEAALGCGKRRRLIEAVARAIERARERCGPLLTCSHARGIEKGVEIRCSVAGESLTIVVARERVEAPKGEGKTMVFTVSELLGGGEDHGCEHTHSDEER